MKIRELTLHILSMIVATGLVAGCSGTTAQEISPAARAATGRPLLLPYGSAKTARPDRGKSWMKPEAKSKQLLYISDQGDGDVYVYSYPAGDPEGTLTGFSFPAGLCSDRYGNVWVTNEVAADKGTSQIIEYAHGGTTPIATLNDPGYIPSGCSVKSNGDLAVANFSSNQPSGSGDLQIYKAATGAVKTYTNPSFDFYSFVSYDSSGNLFVDGLNVSGGFVLAEVARRSRKLESLALDQVVNYPGAVQWDGKYMTVGDPYGGYYGNESMVYQFTVNGSTASAVGSTLLSGACEVAQYSIPHPGKNNAEPQGTTLIGPDLCNVNIGFWHYPAGTGYKTIAGNSEPFGSAISKNP